MGEDLIRLKNVKNLDSVEKSRSLFFPYLGPNKPGENIFEYGTFENNLAYESVFSNRLRSRRRKKEGKKFRDTVPLTTMFGTLQCAKQRSNASTPNWSWL